MLHVTKTVTKNKGISHLDRLDIQIGTINKQNRNNASLLINNKK